MPTEYRFDDLDLREEAAHDDLHRGDMVPYTDFEPRSYECCSYGCPTNGC